MIHVAEFRERFPLLAGDLSDEESAAFVALLEEREVAERELVLREGVPSAAIFLVREGELSVSLSLGGPTLETGRFGAGAILGEVSFIDGGPATATVAAATRTRLWVLPRASLDRLRSESPRQAIATLRAVSHSLAKRVRGGNDFLDGLLRSAGQGAPVAPPPRPSLRASLRALFGI
jgi:CRP-like cAMP-binding protein